MTRNQNWNEVILLDVKQEPSADQTTQYHDSNRLDFTKFALPEVSVENVVNKCQPNRNNPYRIAFVRENTEQQSAAVDRLETEIKRNKSNVENMFVLRSIQTLKRENQLLRLEAQLLKQETQFLNKKINV